MPSNMKNIKGTLLPSFKLRANGGIELISAAVKKGESVVSKFKVKDSEGIHEVAYYDAVIESKDILRMTYSTETAPNGTKIDILKLVLRDNEQLEIPLKINSDVLLIPQDAENNEIAVYARNAENKVSLGRSHMKLVKDKNLAEFSEGEVPSGTVVLGYIEEQIGSARETLSKRLDGSGVNEVLLN